MKPKKEIESSSLLHVPSESVARTLLSEGTNPSAEKSWPGADGLTLATGDSSYQEVDWKVYWNRQFDLSSGLRPLKERKRSYPKPLKTHFRPEHSKVRVFFYGIEFGGLLPPIISISYLVDWKEWLPCNSSKNWEKLAEKPNSLGRYLTRPLQYVKDPALVTCKICKSSIERFENEDELSEFEGGIEE